MLFTVARGLFAVAVALFAVDVFFGRMLFTVARGLFAVADVAAVTCDRFLGTVTWQPLHVIAFSAPGGWSGRAFAFSQSHELKRQLDAYEPDVVDSDDDNDE